LAFVTFDLHPGGEAPSGEGMRGPQAIFVLAASSRELLAARIVQSANAGGSPQVRDLLIDQESA
jgi:hypothetical protein